jgi:hypothetical protein
VLVAPRRRRALAVARQRRIAARVPRQGARDGDAPVLRYGGAGGLQYAANWTLLRDSVPETNNPHRASKFLAEASPAPRYVVTDDDETEEFGPLTGGTEILRVPHRHNPAQVLFGNAAAAAASR